MLPNFVGQAENLCGYGFEDVNPRMGVATKTKLIGDEVCRADERDDGIVAAKDLYVFLNFMMQSDSITDVLAQTPFTGEHPTDFGM